MTSSRDVIKEKLLNFTVLGDLSNNSYTNIVVWYIIWKVFTQRFQIFSNFWSMTSSCDVIKEKILLLGDWSSNSFATIVVWYIKWKVFIQTFLIFLYFWSLTSSCDVIKEKLLNIAVLCDSSDKSITAIVVRYIRWKMFIQKFLIFIYIYDAFINHSIIISFNSRKKIFHTQRRPCAFRRCHKS